MIGRVPYARQYTPYRHAFACLEIPRVFGTYFKLIAIKFNLADKF